VRLDAAEQVVVDIDVLDAHVVKPALAVGPADGDPVLPEAADVHVGDAEVGELYVPGEVGFELDAAGLLRRLRPAADDVQVADLEAAGIQGGDAVAAARGNRRAAGAVAADPNRRRRRAAVERGKEERSVEGVAAAQRNRIARLQVNGVHPPEARPREVGRSVVPVVARRADEVGREKCPVFKEFDHR
jgi:hypothetical protein